ncbi:hypothetical protein J2Z69_002705 [Paenibacillus shirakamiensis]|uniref:Uncharacterized protein n=1 Tax=Paenibacillus shirakamiensis TaxID=1265935 RepID=A0ABS4JIX8_9BACL|nr:hypothetical protein [Paenibacillus shirakamiensis]
MNILTLNKLIRDVRVFRVKQWGALLCTLVTVGALGILENIVLGHLLGGLNEYVKSIIQFLGLSILILIVYPVLLQLTNVITQKDILSYPVKLQKLLGLIRNPLKARN